MMNRTAFALFLFTALIAGSARPVGADERPDVLFIALDDLNDWVGVLGGHPQAKTPNIDRLARRGMLFTNAHTVVPMCAPTRSALLTGLRPETSGIYGPGVDFQTVEELRDTVTLPMHFRQNGYRVIGGGKIFHAHTLAPRGFQGFQHKPSWDAYYPSFERQLPEEVRPRAWPANKNPNMSYGLFDWSPVATEDYAMGDGQVVNWAVEQLERKREQPLFLAVGIYRPHMPWYVPRKYFDLFPLEEIELPPTVADDRADLPEIAKRGVTYQAHQWVVETGGWKAAVQAYLASITFADEMVGRLLDALDASDRADETIIVLFRSRLPPRRERLLAQVHDLGGVHPCPDDLRRPRRDAAEYTHRSAGVAARDLSDLDEARRAVATGPCRGTRHDSPAQESRSALDPRRRLYLGTGQLLRKGTALPVHPLPRRQRRAL